MGIRGTPEMMDAMAIAWNASYELSEDKRYAKFTLKDSATMSGPMLPK